MKIGFTGTRDGCTGDQFLKLRSTVDKLTPTLTDFECHHGDCVGADAEFHEIAQYYGAKIVIHPPTGPADDPLRANCELGHPIHEMREPLSHFARNRAIVDETDVLIVCPAQMEHQPRGGTWYTHDYAIKKKKPVVIVWPDGTATEK